MIKFAVCDDDPHMVREISELIEGYMKESGRGPYSVERFTSGAALLESGGGFDVLFLDVRMERPDGMETAGQLRRRGERGLIIFVTALKEYVFDAFGVEAYDYLIKPLDSSGFRRTMDRAMKSLEGSAAKTLVVRRGTECRLIPLAEIVYCEVLGRKIYIHESGGAVTDYYDRLEDLERRVGRGFFRCHRSYLVNLDYVRGCRSGRVMLPGGDTVPVSRLREQELLQAILRHMKEGEP